MELPAEPLEQEADQLQVLVVELVVEEQGSYR